MARHAWLTTKQPKDAPLVEDVHPPQEEAPLSPWAQPLICHAIMIIGVSLMALCYIFHHDHRHHGINDEFYDYVHSRQENFHCQGHCHDPSHSCEVSSPSARAVPGPDSIALLPLELHLLRYRRPRAPGRGVLGRKRVQSRALGLAVYGCSALGHCHSPSCRAARRARAARESLEPCERSSSPGPCCQVSASRLRATRARLGSPPPPPPSHRSLLCPSLVGSPCCCNGKEEGARWPSKTSKVCKEGHLATLGHYGSPPGVAAGQHRRHRRLPHGSSRQGPNNGNCHSTGMHADRWACGQRSYRFKCYLGSSIDPSLPTT